MTWDKTKPGDSDRVRQGDDAIREMKTDIEDALNEEHSFPVNSGAPVCYHNIPAGTTAARPVAGVAGRWYYNTDDEVIQRDNGATWDDITTVSPFESGTTAFFAQSTVPSGWTRDASSYDRLLRVVSSAGAGTGGTATVTISPETFSHNHGGFTDTVSFDAANAGHSGTAIYLGGAGSGTVEAGIIGHSGTSHAHTLASDNYTHGHTITGWTPAYKDVIAGIKN